MGVVVMYPVQFNKSRAEEALSAIENNQPIPAPPEGWDRHELLQVAGVCFSVAFLIGPPRTEADLAVMETWPAEHLEAAEEGLAHDLHDALDFYSALLGGILSGDYDRHHGPTVRGIVWRDDDGPKISFTE
jgi:hypothetical protein